MQTLFDKTRKTSGKRVTLIAFCSHGKQTIKNGQPFQHCPACDGPKKGTFSTPNTTPFFNRGLGCVTYGTRDAEKIAKRKGLQPVGDATPKEIFKSMYPDHYLTRGL